MVVHVVQMKVHSILFVDAFSLVITDGALTVLTAPMNCSLAPPRLRTTPPFTKVKQGEFLRVVFAQEVEFSRDLLRVGTGGRHASGVEPETCETTPLLLAIVWIVVGPGPH
jgi:hypothetical protein